MENSNKLNDFYKRFKEFETIDGSFDFSSLNTPFDLYKWIDKLNDDLFDSNLDLAEQIIKRVENTPYLEFEYAWKYIREQLDNYKNHLNWNDHTSPTETDFYSLQNLSTFIYSLLNRITMIHYILDNENSLEEYIKNNQNLTPLELKDKLKDKLKRVTFNNWRYNKYISEYEDAILWKYFLLESRNMNEHYGVLVKSGGDTEFSNVLFSLYPEIIINIYFFLFYLDKYVEQFNNQHHE